MNDLVTHALMYAGKGIAVFPYKKDKTPACPHGQKDATRDPDVIKKWFSNCNDLMIGIATGDISGGLLVIDLDRNHGNGADGVNVLEQWEAHNGKLPDTVRVNTPSGGVHLYFLSDRCGQYANKAAYTGVDIMANGGKVIASPSERKDGAYHFTDGHNLFDGAQIAPADDTVYKFIAPALKRQQDKTSNQTGGKIETGSRNDTLFRLACSYRNKGLSETAALGAVHAENEARCVSPLPDDEIKRIVDSAFSDKYKDTPHDTSLVPVSEIEKKIPEWLICGYIPRYQITTMAGDGGAGKTSIWCAIAAAVSQGVQPDFLQIPIKTNNTDRKVLYFSAEDTTEHVLRNRLEKHGADLQNCLTLSATDERFSSVKFTDKFLEQLIEVHRPALCIFDPIQAFIPRDFKMAERNAMRQCLAPLIGYGEKYGTTFLIIVHSNKRAGAWGRNRIADSADIWDISRSVLIVGDAGENDLRYLSHEKCNVASLSETVLFSLENEIVTGRGKTQRRDREFVQAADMQRQTPARDEAKQFILNTLQGGEIAIKELDNLASGIGISSKAMRSAKEEMKNTGVIRYRQVSSGRGSGVKWYVSLT